MRHSFTHKFLVATLFGALVYSFSAYAQEQPTEFAFEKPSRLSPDATNKDPQFESEMETARVPTGESITVRQAYGTLTFDIANGNEAYVRQLLGHFQAYLKSNFGNDSGTYTLVARARSKDGKLDIKQPILTFQWENKRILFFDKVVKQASDAKFSGWILDGVRLNDDANTLELSAMSYFKKSVSIDFSVFQAIGKLVNASQLATVIPLSTPTLAVIDSVGGIFKLFFDKESEVSHSESRDVKFIDGDVATNGAYQFPFTFSKKGTTVPIRIWVNLRASVTKSHLGPAFDGTQFDQTKLSASLVEEATVKVGDSRIQFLDALSQSASDLDKPLRPFLTALIGNKAYKESDITDQCGKLYSSLNRYFSSADARAMFWSFVVRFGHKFSTTDCLAGNRKEELAAVGLTFN